MGHPDDAALGLPPVMTGPDSTRRLDTLTGTKPGGATDSASPMDGASWVDRAADKRVAAYARLVGSLTTTAQHEAATAYQQAVTEYTLASIAEMASAKRGGS